MCANEPINGTSSLVVAITGHRDLFPEDFAELEAEVRRLLTQEKAKYPNTPLLLLSGLAEGADRIGARVAIALSIPYIAVLPIDPDLYVDDFASPASIREFEELLSSARSSIIMPLANGSTREDISRNGLARDRQYECQGQFLVNASQFLIAIWDKVETGKVGGTGEVVNLKLGKRQRSGHITFARVNGSGAGPVHIILARRKSTGAEMPTGTKCKVEYPKGTVCEEFEASYKLLDRYNADIAANAGKQQEVRKSWNALCEGNVATGLTPAMRWVAGVYSWADMLALSAAKRSLQLWNIVFILLAFGGLALGMMQILDRGWVMLLSYYAALILALLVAQSEVWAKRRVRHEDYRALAEALRVQFFWLAAGLPDLASAQYLRKQAGEMIWIRDALSECSLYGGLFANIRQTTKDAAARLDLARVWVKGQAKYFHDTSLKYQNKRTIFNRFAFLMAGIGFAFPIVGVPTQSIAAQTRLWIEPLSHAIAGVALVWASLAWNYMELRGFAREARQYAQMYDLFRAADELLEDFEADSSKESFTFAEETIRELGIEALSENGDWLAMHRERKLSPGLATG
jgi:hypothetical protein